MDDATLRYEVFVLEELLLRMNINITVVMPRWWFQGFGRALHHCLASGWAINFLFDRG